MHCYWQGASLRGVQGLPVRVEVQMARGLPALSLVGQAGAATRESRERVYGALRESGYSLPRGRVTVNLAPADERKEGTAFDLAHILEGMKKKHNLDRHCICAKALWLLAESEAGPSDADGLLSASVDAAGKAVEERR